MAIEKMTNADIFSSSHARLENSEIPGRRTSTIHEKEIFPIRISTLLSRDLVFCFAPGDPVASSSYLPHPGYFSETWLFLPMSGLVFHASKWGRIYILLVVWGFVVRFYLYMLPFPVPCFIPCGWSVRLSRTLSGCSFNELVEFNEKETAKRHGQNK